MPKEYKLLHWAATNQLEALKMATNEEAFREALSDLDEAIMKINRYFQKTGLSVSQRKTILSDLDKINSYRYKALYGGV